MDKVESKRLKDMMECLLCRNFGRIDRLYAQRESMLKMFYEYFPESKQWLKEFEEYMKKERQIHAK